MNASKVGAMDAGLAAVLGALAGSVATIGAALTTGWTQREGVRITARSEHRSQRREPRNSSYKKFITEASRLRDLAAAFTVAHAEFPYETVDSVFAGRCEIATRTVQETWVDVALAGPKQVSEAAAKLERLSNALAFRILGLHRLVSDESRMLTDRALDGIKDVIAGEAEEFDRTLDVFVLLAQAALDDDGTL
ncbi:hypothetical protein ACFU6I_46395 [Streptomyces sp. NPDC057486]|uniref:hypothetical protein n=1 Tax=Streptomyces sp. NPDC057486 TaxID=3346145 RepID=UPI003691E0D7